MSASGRTIFIAGAGIAGMTLALALAKFGARVVILERNHQVQEYGAGLQISPNGRHVLNRLGLDRALDAVSFEPDGIDIYPFAAREPLLTLELGAIMRERYGAPYVVMHRADLAELLFRACKRFANIDILFDVKAYDVEELEDGVVVEVDEADGKSRNGRVFAFIGADGVHSRTRTDVLGGPRARYSGMVAWRTTLDLRHFPDTLAHDRTSLLWASGYHAVTYPLPHRNQVNVVLFGRVPEAQLRSETAPHQPDLPWSLRRSAQFEALFDAAGSSWGFWPCSAVETATWSRGSIGLIGDAAHAMLPFQAQGAVMAIEDAAVLAPLLMTAPDAASAFARYATLRQSRVRRVQMQSVNNGRAFHLEWPFSLARDAVVAAQGPRGHLDRLDWLYGHDATEGGSLAPMPQPGQAGAH